MKHITNILIKHKISEKFDLITQTKLENQLVNYNQMVKMYKNTEYIKYTP